LFPALQNVAAKAERVLTEIKADIKADFGQPTSPDDIARLNGRHNHGERVELAYT